MKKHSRLIWVLFGLVLIIKIFIVYFRNGPFIFPDEGCIIQRAIYFANTFEIKGCSELLNLPLGDAYPLYSILLAPIYKFFHGILAYQLGLVLNAILVSSLIFPISGILNTYSNNKRFCIIAAAITVFLPQFTSYEKTLMTETLYSSLMIFSLYFYVKSLSSAKRVNLNKILTIFFAILLSLTRPLGFIFLIAIIINEFIISKNKKKILMIYLPLGVLMTFISTHILSKGIAVALFANGRTLIETGNWQYAIRSISDQLNSFTIATLFIPLIIFSCCFFRRDFKKFSKLKYMILIYIIINFLVSAHHIVGYLLPLHYSPNLITRYIHSSVILIFICSLIFINKYKSLQFSIGNTIFIIILLISILFSDVEAFGFTLGFDMMPFLDFAAPKIEQDLVPTLELYRKAILFVIFALFFIVCLRMKKLLVAVGVAIITIFAITTYIAIQNYSKNPVFIKSLEQLNKSNIALVITPGDRNLLGEFWALKSISKHNVKLVLFDSRNNYMIDNKMIEESSDLNTADYIISPIPSSLPIFGSTVDVYIYENK